MASPAGQVPEAIDLRQELSDHFTIRVLVVPVGKVRPAVLARCLKVLQEKCTRLSVGGAEMRFSYVLREPDRRWNEFQFHRRILCVLGIVDGQETSSLATAQCDFVLMSSKISSALELRCLALNPQDHGDDEESEVPESPSVTLVYANLEDELEVALQAQMTECATSLLGRLSGTIMQKLQEKGEGPTLLKTPAEEAQGCDDGRVAGRKRALARVEKFIADAWLVQANTAQAGASYQNAARLTRESGDWLWLAGSTEGLAACLSLRITSGTDSTIKPLDVVARYREVRLNTRAAPAHARLLKARCKTLRLRPLGITPKSVAGSLCVLRLQ
eukprot:m.47466 g.47466  ORF g.47466 m.47466 type:complete len:330 (+) comp6358_c0_seq2:101-1090(+)